MHTGMTRRLECAVLCCAARRPGLGTREGGWCKVGGMTAYPHLTAGEPGFHAEESMTLRCQPPMFQINGAHQLRMIARVQLPLGPLQKRTTINEIKALEVHGVGPFCTADCYAPGRSKPKS